jgi:hypothetical protein
MVFVEQARNKKTERAVALDWKMENKIVGRYDG